MRFKVTGNHKVAGVDPGKTVELDADAPTTTALIQGGHITAAPKKTTKGEG